MKKGIVIVKKEVSKDVDEVLIAKKLTIPAKSINSKKTKKAVKK